METAGYMILLAVAILWLLGMIIGMVAAFPYGLIGIVVLLGIGLLFAHVVKTRRESADDEYYSKHIDK